MIKALINLNNELVSVENTDIKEVYIEWLYITDNIVICEKTKSICKYQDSAQGKNRLKQLKKIKKPTEFEAQELKFLSL